MNICNNSEEDVKGQIKYKIIMPNGKIDNFDLNRTESIKAKSELNEYDKYYIKIKCLLKVSSRAVIFSKKCFTFAK